MVLRFPPGCSAYFDLLRPAYHQRAPPQNVTGRPALSAVVDSSRQKAQTAQEFRRFMAAFGGTMDQRKITSFLQLLGLASLGYAIYNAWSIYNGLEAQLMRGLSGMLQASSSAGWADQLTSPYALPHLIINQPWAWLGVVLLLAPSFLGMTRGGSAPFRSTPPVPDEPTFAYLVECKLCKKPVSSTAPTCPNCGNAMS